MNVVWYYFGVVVFMILSAGASIRSNSNGLPISLSGLKTWFKFQLFYVVMRLVIALIIFVVWYYNQGTLPVIRPDSAILAGLGMDAFSDKVFAVTGLQVQIPKIIPPDLPQ